MSEDDICCDEDAFWQLALMSHLSEIQILEGEYKDLDEEIGRSTYRLNDYVTLSLTSTPISSINTAVGSNIWHASSVLAELPIRISKHATILELGSGAVGLGGMGLATRMNAGDVVLLSDTYCDGILDCLKANVTYNQSSFACRVEAIELDWSRNELPLNVPPLDLVVGSEVVYTHETSRLMANVVSLLLQHSRNAHVLLLQVMDRPGWSDFVLETSASYNVSILQPLPPEWHEAGVKLLGAQIGSGTLARLDYGLCWIRNVDNENDCGVMLEEDSLWNDNTYWAENG
jgi:hypothetical protein